jgi:hypothetical protein
MAARIEIVKATGDSLQMLIEYTAVISFDVAGMNVAYRCGG